LAVNSITYGRVECRGSPLSAERGSRSPRRLKSAAISALVERLVGSVTWFGREHCRANRCGAGALGARFPSPAELTSWAKRSAREGPWIGALCVEQQSQDSAAIMVSVFTPCSSVRCAPRLSIRHLNQRPSNQSRNVNDCARLRIEVGGKGIL
jgi:hypothetical protein